MSGNTSLRYVGAEVAPVVAPDWGAEDGDATLERLLRAGPGDAAGMPKVAPGALGILADEAGDEFAILPTEGGPSLVPYLSGAPIDPDGPMTPGGFLPAEAVEARRGGPGSGGGVPDPKAMRRALIEALIEAGVIDRALWNRVRRSLDDAPASAGPSPRGRSPSGSRGASEPGTGGPAGPHDGDAEAPDGAEGADGGAPAPEDSGGGEGIWEGVKDKIPTMAAEQFGTAILGNLLTGEGLRPSSLLSGASGLVGAIGSAVVMGHVQRLLTKGLDDESSTAEWALKTVGPQVGMKIFGMGNFGLYFGDEQSPYESPALRVDDADQKGNKITVGCGSVWIEGKFAARVGDPVEKAGVNCIYGAREVRIGGQDAARVDKTLAGSGYGTKSADANAPFLVGAARTLIGGPTNRPAGDPPPIPEQWPEDTTGIPHDAKFPHSPNDPDNPRRTEAGYSYDEAKGEWIMWHPDRGWSTTLLERARVGFGPEWFLHETSWDPDTGVWNLGSPEWPGAGVAGSWWVPDHFWWDPLDMSTYWKTHDWLFGPDDPRAAFNPMLLVLTEWAAFVDGMNWNPLRWPLQLIYSAATSGAALLAWWESFGQELDHALGFPDRYAHRDRVRNTPPVSRRNRPSEPDRPKRP